MSFKAREGGVVVRVGGRAAVTRTAFLIVAAALTMALVGAPAAWAKPARNRVKAVEVLRLSEGGSEVFVRTDRTPDYAARVAQGGKRLIVDLTDTVVAGAEPALTDVEGVVGGVMTQGFRQRGRRTTRLLIQLLKTAEYRIRAHDQGLRIMLRPADATRVAGAGGPDAGRTSTEGNDGDASSAEPVVAVRDVAFDHAARRDRVIVELDGTAGYTTQTKSPTRTVLRLPAVGLPATLRRKLDVAAYGGFVRAISTYRVGSAVLVDVDHDADAHSAVVPYGSALHLVFSSEETPPTMTGVAPDGGAARKAVSLPTRGVGLQPEEWSSEPDQAGAFLPSTTPGQVRRYTGRRINVDLKDADIANVLRILAEAGRVNIVAADNISGSVTIRLKNVPWDQALDTVLQAKKLGMVRRGNIIRVALMSDLNKERELALARRKSELELAPIETRLIPISYASAADLQARAQELLSPRGSIAVDERTNVLIVRDVSGNLNQVEELTRALDTQTPQVLIEARIVEATSRFQRDVGIQWGGDLAFGAATGAETGLFFPSSIGVIGGNADPQTPTGGLSPTQALVPNPNFAVNLPATTGSGQGGALGLTFGSLDNTVNLNVRLSAAEATGMLRIVSSPRILTLDNHEARINQGTLIPFSQVSAQGVQTVFQEAKLQLLVVPHVTADGSVSMHVKINRDEPDFNQTSARGDPTILKREAETDLLVRDGHTAVIGGIYTRNSGRNLDQIPLLGDIPILGVLFQRRRSSDVRGELVIFLTPRIVNRAEAMGR
ncbi:MAG: type IV pilus secretin PilQ [Myxococcota bacterium]